MDAPVYEETYRHHSIKIYQDPDAENPREWDNIDTLICCHSRYTLGDKHSFSGGREFLLDLCELDDDCALDVDQSVKRAEKIAVILSVYLYDHSGLAMNTTGFHCPWDSGQVGFIYATLETIREEYSCKHVSSKQLNKVAEHLAREVATFSDYLEGRVYGYVVEKNEEEVDSCWGFLGDYDEYCLEAAHATAA